MSLSDALKVPSFYEAYTAAKQRNEQAGPRELAQAGALQQLYTQMQQQRQGQEDRQRNEALRSAIAALPPDQRTRENVLPLLLQHTSNVKEIVPLMKGKEDGGFSLAPEHTRFDAAGNPIVTAPSKARERQRFDGENVIQEELQPDGTYKEIGRGPRFARQVAQASNVGAGETPAGLSKQYAEDPTYKKNVDYWANFLKDGGTLPPRFAQSGAGKKMMPDILNVVPTLGPGRELLANQVDLTGQKSQARAVGTRSAAVEMAAGEAREMMPILISTSENFKRTGYQPINRVLKSYADNSGSVESRQFGAALNTFINVYARAISPSGVPTVSDKDHAREVLSTADSHEQLVGLLKVLDQEMSAAQAAPTRVRAAQRSGITGAPAPSHGPTPPKNAKGWPLMQDAKGNKAYVGPNSEIEEVR